MTSILNTEFFHLQIRTSEVEFRPEKCWVPYFLLGFLVIFFVYKKNYNSNKNSKKVFSQKKNFIERKFEKCCEAKRCTRAIFVGADKISTRKKSKLKVWHSYRKNSFHTLPRPQKAFFFSISYFEKCFYMQSLPTANVSQVWLNFRTPYFTTSDVDPHELDTNQDPWSESWKKTDPASNPDPIFMQSCHDFGWCFAARIREALGPHHCYQRDKSRGVLIGILSPSPPYKIKSIICRKVLCLNSYPPLQSFLHFKPKSLKTFLTIPN